MAMHLVLLRSARSENAKLPFFVSSIGSQFSRLHRIDRRTLFRVTGLKDKYSRTSPLIFTQNRWTCKRLSSSLSVDANNNQLYCENDEIVSFETCTHSSFNISTKSKQLFEVTAKYDPTGDQPQAIQKLSDQLMSGSRFSILKGITGTGKTFVMSHVIAKANRPCLVLCHNKTLAAQLARELRSFLSKSAVEFFVSYYNHYVPESFQETSGRYTAKKSSVNSEIDALRHRATRALLTREDVVVVSSVSCIYGLGLPREYLDACMDMNVFDIMSWSDLINRLLSMLYTISTNDDDFSRGQFQVQQSTAVDKRTIVLWAPHEKFPTQINFIMCKSPESSEGKTENDSDILFKIESIREGKSNGLVNTSFIRIFPAKHHVVSDDRLERACLAIEEELSERLKELKAEGKHEEAGRLQTRVTNDVYMMRETGFCSGGENYSRHLAGRQPGLPPYTLMEYMGTGINGEPREWLLIVDESHVTLPQLSAMYAGDQERKRKLVKHGYRLPSALDNRPLKDVEFWNCVKQTVFVSATPSQRELSMTRNEPVEMIIRPTYICDPEIIVRPTEGQLQDLLDEVKKRSDGSSTYAGRTLVTTLTKRDAEDLSLFMNEHGVKCTYIHSGLSTHERSNALKALQSGDIDCLVGVNLLREGLDLPQVSLVAILNADSEGFLRCKTSLLQTVGRAARNVHGVAIFYANRITDSMKKCIETTKRHREHQLDYIAKHGRKMISTTGSSVLSIFDLLKDEISEEKTLEIVTQDRSSTYGGTNKNLITSSMNVGVDNTLRSRDIVTDHIPSDPGVYFWKDCDGKILYIGKALRLRSRVKSYFSQKANHGRRIRTMMEKATSVEFIITPSERDALVLESNLIKHHQPKFNVLLKDDEHYPYICASIGDSVPRLFVVPRKHELKLSTSKYRYYGPYTSLKEVNQIIDGVEEKYGLRSLAFLVRHGSEPQEKYNKNFDKVIEEVFNVNKNQNGDLVMLRKKFEEAGLLFDSKFNYCRDIVAVSQSSLDSTSIVVHIIQLRNGLVAGSFSYTCNVPFGISNDEDYADAIHVVLTTRHYPSAPTKNEVFSWFPEEILLPYEPIDEKDMKEAIRRSRADSGELKSKVSLKINTIAKSGQKRASDIRASEFATKNANQALSETEKQIGVPSLYDGTAAAQLANLLNLDKPPSRIECFDVSHTQGIFPVASRVVFIDGKPAPHLYRLFNIRPVDGGDDFSSITEVVERRFKRMSKLPQQSEDSDKIDIDREPWSRPDLVLIDGGKGQLSAAIQGMMNANFQIYDSSYKSNKNGMHNVPICALAKNQEQVFVPGQEDPVNCSVDDAAPAMLLLRSLRDESHRFALNAHRRRRSIVKSF